MKISGEIIREGASNSALVPAATTAGRRLRQATSTANDVDWVDEFAAVGFVIDGGGSAITTGIKGDLEVPFAGTIVGWTLLADQSGNCVIDIWKDTYTNFPPVVGDSITASAKPTLSSVAKNANTTMTGWTTSITAGDILRINVDSVATITKATLTLKVKKS